MNKVINIQFLRAIAAFIVVLYHTADHYFAVVDSSTTNIYSIIKQFGYVGVDLFFVISGYVIWVSTKKVSDLVGIINFAYGRLTRIYFGYWPYFFILLIITYLFSNELNTVDIIGSFFLTQKSPDKMLLKVSWTLSYELCFYLFFSGLLFLPRRKIIYVLYLLGVVIIAVQLWGIFISGVYLKNNFPTSHVIFKFYLSPFYLEFIAGCLIAFYFENKRVNNLMAVFIAAFVFFVLAIFYQNINEVVLDQGYYYPQRVILLGSMSVFIVVGLIELEGRGIVLFPYFSTLIGEASYSLYLSHTIILYGLYVIGVRTIIKEFGKYQGLLMILVVLLIVGYSIMHYQLVETPLMSLTKKFKIWIQQKMVFRGFFLRLPNREAAVKLTN
ncbi:MAG: acyltransferase [Candidatus Contendobacter sp.]|nr:acyltransferase [Candidatus Contendobacter sp.]